MQLTVLLCNEGGRQPFFVTYNGYNGGWPLTWLFDWSAADWSRPDTNKSISSERRRKSLLFCWERKSWTSWLLTCCSKKGWTAHSWEYTVLGVKCFCCHAHSRDTQETLKRDSRERKSYDTQSYDTRETLKRHLRERESYAPKWQVIKNQACDNVCVCKYDHKNAHSREG